MAHSQATTKYTEKLVIRHKKLYRVITAQYKKNKPLEVLKWEIGKDRPLIRNIEIVMIGGWVYIDPADKSYRWYKNNNKDSYGIDKWWVCGCNCSLSGATTQSYEDIEKLLLNSDYKDFVYSLRVIKQQQEEVNTYLIFNLISMWLSYPNNEYLIKLGYYNLALCKTLLKMNKKKQFEYIQYLYNHSELDKYINFTMLQCKIKGIEDYMFFCECKKNLEVYKYLKKQQQSYLFYRDYLNLVVANGHNIEEDYWKYPSHLSDKYDLMKEEAESIRIAKEMKIIRRIKKVSKGLSCLNTTIKGYEVAVPTDIEDIREQAKVLDQCLMTNGYYKSYADKKCILIFFKKNGKRLATAEIFYDKKKPLGQFYADERDRRNCKPNKVITNVLNNWLANVYQPTQLTC